MSLAVSAKFGSENSISLSVSRNEIARAAEVLASGHGAFAVDAERASGFRYSNRAYLVQIRRAGAGTVLIDPVNYAEDPVATLAPVAEVLATDEWVLHAADQDLPCLAEIGIKPPRLYETELAKLIGEPQCGFWSGWQFRKGEIEVWRGEESRPASHTAQFETRHGDQERLLGLMGT